MNHEQSTSSLATTRMETTRVSTSSIATGMDATTRQQKMVRVFSYHLHGPFSATAGYHFSGDLIACSLTGGRG